MSKYTTEVRYICETYAGYKKSQPYTLVNSIISESWNKIFEDFPIFDENYRSVLCCKILKHFYTQEIGAETVGLWKLWLNERMNMIMPYYNKLYQSELLEFNPLYDVDFTTSGNRNTDYDENTRNDAESDYTRTDNLTQADDSTTDVKFDTERTRTDDLTETGVSTTDLDRSVSSNETSNTNRDVDTDSTQLYSDTPQGSISDLSNNTYLTNATIDSSTQSDDTAYTDTASSSENSSTDFDSTTRNTGTQNNQGTDYTNTDYSATKTNTGTQNNKGTDNRTGLKTFTNIDDYSEHVIGKRGGASYSSMLMEFRQTFLNIDMMICDELQDLFMGLW